MEFFIENRNYIIFFRLFSLWSFWKNCKNKISFQVYSIFLMTSVICSFTYGFILDHLYEYVSLSTTVRCWLFVTMLMAYLVTAIESLYKTKAQEELVQKFSIVDHLFSRKMRIYVPYQQEKQELFVRNCIVITIILFFSVHAAIHSDFASPIVYSLTISIWIVRLRSVRVMFFVYLMQNRLSLINNELVNIRNILSNHNRNTHQRPISTVDLMTINFQYKRVRNLKIIYLKIFSICI